MSGLLVDDFQSPRLVDDHMVFSPISFPGLDFTFLENMDNPGNIPKCLIHCIPKEFDFSSVILKCPICSKDDFI